MHPERIKQLIVIIVLGAVGWSVILSIGYGSIVIYLPLPLYGVNAEWVGSFIAWALFCFLPGVPLWVAFKQVYKRSEKFRKFIGAVK